MSYVCAVEVSESRGDPRCDVESRCVVKMMSVSAACVNAGVGVNSRPDVHASSADGLPQCEPGDGHDEQRRE